MPEIPTASKPAVVAAPNGTNNVPLPVPPPPPATPSVSPSWTKVMPWWVPAGVALLCVICYFCSVYLLYGKTDMTTVNADQWQRLLFIFHSIETIGFSALGVILGVTIQAPQLKEAVSKAVDANKNAANQKERGDGFARNIHYIQSLQASRQERARLGSPANDVDFALDRAIRTAHIF